MLLLPAIVLEIVFLAGLLYVLGGTSHVGREALIPVLGGLVLVLFIFLLPACRRGGREVCCLRRRRSSRSGASDSPSPCLMTGPLPSP
ncbi:MAG: hypothetical protein H0U11_03345 [Chloroflexi bacterium]|nr:hypothetical protein [Chloroflexota bacterium]